MVWHERLGCLWTVRFAEEESAGGGWHDDASGSIGGGDYEAEEEEQQHDNDTVELRVTFTRDEYDTLEALAEHLDLWESDVVRKAVTLMNLLVEKRDSGYRVVLQDESRELYAVDF